MDLFNKNLELLRAHDQTLAKRVEKIPFPENVIVTAAKNGSPVPNVQSVFIHSAYNPEEEAKKSVSASDRPQNNNVVYGLGFGYHILEILKSVSGEVTVVEPRMTLFRAFLGVVDLKPFLPRTKFHIGIPSAQLLARHGLDCENVYLHNPSIRISQGYFDELTQAKEVAEYIQSHKLKIMVVNPIYGGSLPTAQFSARALEELGHEVVSVECEQFSDSFSAIKEITKNKNNTEIISQHFTSLMSEVIIAKAVEFQPDLVLALAQAPLNPKTINRLKGLNVPVVFWFVEDFRTLPYWKEVVSSYDQFFTIQRGKFFEELKSIGADNYYYLPQACHPEVHNPLTLNNEDRQTYGADLSFMGAAYFNRLQSFPRLLEFDFKIWGTGWDKESELGKLVQSNERVTTENCMKIYNGAKINLNLHSSTFHEEVNPNGDFVNPRTFEIAACSAFQLVDERSELYEFFVVGDEIATFNSIEDLKEKTSYYLNNESERVRIASNGYERVLKEHTLTHRMRELLIQTFVNRFDNLKSRLDKRHSAVAPLIDEAGPDTELGKYLTQFEDENSLSLKSIVENIDQGEGDLSKNELLLLMVNQIVKEGE